MFYISGIFSSGNKLGLSRNRPIIASTKLKDMNESNESQTIAAASEKKSRRRTPKSGLLFTKKGRHTYVIDEPSSQVEALPPGVYKVGLSLEVGWFLSHISTGFTFDYKLYGLEKGLIERVKKTYDNTTSNLGVLLNGLKGTGKTVTSKVICQKLGLPVIVVDRKMDNVHTFLNSIPQDIVIFLDEYEKVYGESSEMLTIMDGAMNSNWRRVFLLTTNKLYVDSNLIERPSRIRYMKKFGDLLPAVVEEIVDDSLIHTQFREETLQFISTLEVISVDVVKAIVQEVNIHNEAPSNFEDVFNVEKLKGKFNVTFKDESDENNISWKSLDSGVSVSPKPNFNARHEDNWLQINGVYVGKVQKVLDFNTVIIVPHGEKKNRPKWLKGPMKIRVKESFTYHDNYVYGGEFDEFSHFRRNHEEPRGFMRGEKPSEKGEEIMAIDSVNLKHLNLVFPAESTEKK